MSGDIIDTFTGPAGLLSAHVPDSMPVDCHWQVNTDSTLDGNGNLAGPADFTCTTTAGALFPFDWLQGLALTLEFTPGAGVDTVYARYGYPFSGNYDAITIHCGGTGDLGNGGGDLQFYGGYSGSANAPLGTKFVAGQHYKVVVSRPAGDQNYTRTQIFVNDVLLMDNLPADGFNVSSSTLGISLSDVYTTLSTVKFTAAPPVPPPVVNTSHDLVKVKERHYVPGVPAVPAVPAAPPYTTIEQQQVCKFVKVMDAPPPSGDYTPIGGDSPNSPFVVIGSGVYTYVCSMQNVTVFHPATPAHPGTPGVPEVNYTDYFLGWNAGARSIGFVRGNSYAEFKVRQASVGVICGLNVPDAADAHYSGVNIDYAFYCTHGVARIEENGVFVASVGTFDDSTVFHIERSDTDIIYSMNGTTVHTTPGAPTDDLFLEASLYAGDDSVFEPVLVQVDTLDATDQSGDINFVLPPLLPYGMTGLSALLNFTLPPLVPVLTQGLAAPSYAFLDFTLAPIFPQSFGKTGTVGQIDFTLPALDMLAADHPYGEIDFTLPALGFYQTAYEGNLNASMFGLTVTHDRFDAPTHVVVRMDSHAVIIDAFTVGRAAHALMYSTAQFSVVIDLVSLLNATLLSRLRISGGVTGKNPATGDQSGNDTWAVNLDNNGSTVYENYTFNSYAQIGADYYGANDQGIYLLAGNDDDGVPIRASVNFGTVRFSTTEKKTVESCYVGMASDGYLYLKVTAEGQEYIYRTRSFSQEIQQQRVTPGKGLRTNYVTLELYNEDGDNFEVDTVKFMVADMKRRI